MTLLGPNLASQPFTNERPVRRISILIWILALVLLGINVFLYQRHLTGQHEQSQVLAVLEEGIAAEDEAIADLERQLESLDIEDQNEVVRFLNSEIAKRTFSWSRLFDHLEEVLPQRVEVRRISPRVIHEGRSRQTRRDPHAEVVSIDLSGYAPSSEELLQLIDNLFAHRNFLAPDLQSENEQEDSRLVFSLTVLYKPVDVIPEEADPSVTRFEEAALDDSVDEGTEP